MRLRPILFIAILLGGLAFMCYKYFPVMLSASDINADPTILNGKTLRNGKLGDIVLSDMTLRDVTFSNIEIQSLKAKNVIFIDCEFLETRVYEVIFEGVKFVRGAFSGAYDDIDNATNFNNCRKFDVFFDAVTFIQPTFQNISQGNISFKNIKKCIARRKGHLFLRSSVGSIINLKIEDSTIKNCNFGLSSRKIHNVYIKNSTLIDVECGGWAKTLYIDSCDLNAYLFFPVTGLIKNSTLNISLFGGNKVYFLGNKFIKGITRTCSVFDGDEKSYYYIYGDNTSHYYIAITDGGNYFIYDTLLVNFFTVADGMGYEIHSLNLKNISIYGADFGYTKIKSGQWENVKIYPEATIDNLDAVNLQGYNISFPEGNPWRGEPKRFDFRAQTTPFDWPEIKIPTQEDLGVNWDWPEPTGAPAGK